MPTIAHIAQIDLKDDSGMGRVSCHWREALGRRGFDIVHIGPQETGSVHPALFPFAARRVLRRIRPAPIGVLVHEPAGGPFVGRAGDRPSLAFSHGLEQGGWEAAMELHRAGLAPIPLRSRLLYPLWRLRSSSRALRGATAVLAINKSDRRRVIAHYKRRPEDVFLIRNGCDLPSRPVEEPVREPVILFIGSWIARKGTDVLIAAVVRLLEEGRSLQIILAGTGTSEQTTLHDWPERARSFVRVIPQFARAQERDFLQGAQLVVLPSYFEGQPLSLLQAMAEGRCCIAADIPGHRDLISHEQNGLLHGRGDSVDLARQLSRCLASQDLRTRMGIAAAASVARRDWKTVSDEVSDFVLSRL